MNKKRSFYALFVPLVQIFIAIPAILFSIKFVIFATSIPNIVANFAGFFILTFMDDRLYALFKFIRGNLKTKEEKARFMII